MPLVLLDLEVLETHTDDFVYLLAAKVAAEGAGLLGSGKGILDEPFRGDGRCVYRAWSRSTLYALCSWSACWKD